MVANFWNQSYIETRSKRSKMESTEIITKGNFTLSSVYSNIRNTTTFNQSEIDDDSHYSDILEDVTSYLWRIVPIPLFLIGIVGNILNVVVLKRMKFWQKSTLFFLFVLAYADMTVLCVGLSRYWILYAFDLDLRTLSTWGCKINFFVIYISMQYSSWILVCVTLERFIKTHFPLRYASLVSVRRSGILLGIIFIVLSGVNGQILVTNGLINVDNSTDCDATTKTYHDFEEFAFVYMDFAFLSVVPFISMLIMNIAIYRKLRASHLWRKRSGFDARGVKSIQRFSMKLTKMLLFTSTYFLITTVPISIYFIIDSYYKPTDDMSIAKMDIVWATTYLFQFSNNTVNFYFYTAVNMRYRQQLRALFGCKTIRASRQRGLVYSLQENSSSRRHQHSESMNNPESNGATNNFAFVSEESVEV